MERRVNEWLVIRFERESSESRFPYIPVDSLALHVEEWGSDGGAVWYREPGAAPVLIPLHRIHSVRAYTSQPPDPGPQFVDPTRRAVQP